MPAGDFFADAVPVVTAARRSSEVECERNMVVAASRATATNPETNIRFMEISVWLEMQSGVHHRNTANGCRQMWSASPITILF